MVVVFNGNSLAEKKKKVLKKEVKLLTKKKGRSLSLAAIQVGENKASQVYLRLKEKVAEEVGVNFRRFALPREAECSQVIDLISQLNKDQLIDGIMMQLPLPSSWKKEEQYELLQAIAPQKDIDCLSSANLGLVLIDHYFFLPATVKAVWQVLKEAKINQRTIKGKNICVLGKSNIVGKPLVNLLINMGATVISCHSQTRNLSDFTLKADILISATGKTKLIKEEMVKPKAIVIDVGEPNGDVDFNSVKRVASFITPVPGGVGPVTVVSLFENLVEAVKKS